MPICNALTLTPHTEAVFQTSTRKSTYMVPIKKNQTVKLLIFMNVVCVAMSLGNEHYNKT